MIKVKDKSITKQLSIYDLQGSLKNISKTVKDLIKEYGEDAEIEIDYGYGYYDDIELWTKITYIPKTNIIGENLEDK